MSTTLDNKKISTPKIELKSEKIKLKYKEFLTLCFLFDQNPSRNNFVTSFLNTSYFL